MSIAKRLSEEKELGLKSQYTAGELQRLIARWKEMAKKQQAKSE